jgi:uncharacterized membrane protein YedE/YeeE
MHFLSTLFAGLFFGTGLILSGMANPTKVQNFLDIFGTWDPSLAFVMGQHLVFGGHKNAPHRFFTTCFISQHVRMLTHALS